MKRLFFCRRAWKAHQKVIYSMPTLQANEYATIQWRSLKIAYP